MRGKRTRTTAISVILLSPFISFLSCAIRSSSNDSDAQQRVTSQSAQGGSQEFDVNDLSYLFPLTKDANMLLPKLNDSQTPLMSQKQFDSILGGLNSIFGLDYSNGSLSTLMKSLSNWNVVAMRLNNCSKREAKGPCLQTVNLIVQPTFNRGSTGSSADFAMHLVYVTGKPTESLLKELIEIRNTAAESSHRDRTLGKALSVHPILEVEGLNSPYALKLKNDFIYKHLNPNNLGAVAITFIEPNRLQPWLFVGFNPKTNEFNTKKHSFFQFDVQNPIHNCKVESKRQICKRDLSQSGVVITDSDEKSGGRSDSNPGGMTNEGIPFMDEYLSTILKENNNGFAGVKSNVAKWDDVLNKLDNPNFVGAEESNCASCHRATIERARFAGIIGFDKTRGPFAFSPPSSNSGCSSIDRSTQKAFDIRTKGFKTFSVRNFGYVEDSPIITQRVINETLAACAALKPLMK